MEKQIQENDVTIHYRVAGTVEDTPPTSYCRCCWLNQTFFSPSTFCGSACFVPCVQGLYAELSII